MTVSELKDAFCHLSSTYSDYFEKYREDNGEEYSRYQDAICNPLIALTPLERAIEELTCYFETQKNKARLHTLSVAESFLSHKPLRINQLKNKLPIVERSALHEPKTFYTLAGAK